MHIFALNHCHIIYVSRHVNFVENSFPYQSIIKPFPTCPLIPQYDSTLHSIIHVKKGQNTNINEPSNSAPVLVAPTPNLLLQPESSSSSQPEPSLALQPEPSLSLQHEPDLVPSPKSNKPIPRDPIIFSNPRKHLLLLNMICRKILSHPILLKHLKYHIGEMHVLQNLTHL